MEKITLMDVVDRVRAGQVGIVPTDTLYGLAASAIIPESVERVYSIRGREIGKPCIVLISDVEDLAQFDIVLDEVTSRLLGTVWPGAVSVVLPCDSVKWEYLHRGTGTIAFRVPNNEALREFLHVAGPVIAPSANPAGLVPATTVEESIGYFGTNIDFTVADGKLLNMHSTVARVVDGKFEVIRKGPVNLDSLE
jgi:L-threonylcarbamoyladenylate synthase